MIAGTRKRGPELRHRPKAGGESRSRAPRGAAAGDPAVISGDPEIGVTARHATGAAFRTSACRRSAPPPSLLWSYGGPPAPFHCWGFGKKKRNRPATPPR